jgi:hypothetical protein
MAIALASIALPVLSGARGRAVCLASISLEETRLARLALGKATVGLVLTAGALLARGLALGVLEMARRARAAARSRGAGGGKLADGALRARI